MIGLAVRKDFSRIMETFRKMKVVEIMDLLQAVQVLTLKEYQALFVGYG